MNTMIPPYHGHIDLTSILLMFILRKLTKTKDTPFCGGRGGASIITHLPESCVHASAPSEGKLIKRARMAGSKQKEERSSSTAAATATASRFWYAENWSNVVTSSKWAHKHTHTHTKHQRRRNDGEKQNWTKKLRGSKWEKTTTTPSSKHTKRARERQRESVGKRKRERGSVSERGRERARAEDGAYQLSQAKHERNDDAAQGRK